MSLITPLFLFGLLGIGIPIWLHRLQTQTTDREQFSSTMFLEESKHRIHVQRKLKYLLLMALRILFLAILVFAFSRPLLELAPESILAPDSSHHIIVVDNSFSMNQGNNLNQAIILARGIINNMEDGDQASIYSASSQVLTIVEPTADSTNLDQSLATISADSGRLDLGAMISSLNSLIIESQTNFVIHMISDFQRTGQPARFADLVPDYINGRPVTLTTHPVVSTDLPNWMIESIVAEPQEIIVSVRGFNTEASEKQVSLLINGIAQSQLTQQVPASGQSLYIFDTLEFEEGDNRIEAVISPLDELSADDSRYGVMDNSPPAPVLLITADPEALAVTFSTAALETAPRPYEVQIGEIEDLDSRVLQRYPWVVIDDLGAIDQNLEQALSEYISGGGSVLAALGERSIGVSTLPIGGHSQSSAIVLNNTSSRIITRIDSSHPTLTQSSGWTDVNIARVLPISATEEDSVLISLNNDTPLLLEREIGRGRFMLLNTSFDDTWTDLPKKPAFVSFMAEAARYLSNENILLREQLTDSFLQLSDSGGASGQVFDPEGNSLLSLQDTTQAQDIQLSQTGFYQVFTPGGEVLIAVNPDIRESDLTFMGSQTLENWQNTVAGTASQALDGQNNEAANANIAADPVEMEIWRVFLLLLVIIVLAESLLSNRYLSFKTGTS